MQLLGSRQEQRHKGYACWVKPPKRSRYRWVFFVVITLVLVGGIFKFHSYYASADVAPTVSITSPAADTTYYYSGQVITIAASASDSSGISKVEFYRGLTLISTDTTAPYSTLWLVPNPAIPTTYTFTAKAYNTASTSVISAPINVNVNIDHNIPTITTWDIQPRTTTGAITATFSTTDSGGAHLQKLDLLHASYDATYCTAANDSACSWSIVNTVTAPSGLDSWSGSVTDAPSAIGSYIYGITVYDNANNSVYEPYGIQVDVASQIAPSTKFAIGNRVQTTANLNVRATPTTGGTLLGTQSSGVLGSVIGGSVNVDGFNWWQIDYDIGSDGWSAEDFLIPAPVAPTITITSPTDGAIFYGSTMSVTAAATDGVGITKIEFYDNDILQCTKTAIILVKTWSPTCGYPFDSTSFVAGINVLTAKVYNSSGAMAISSPVSITVILDNTPPTASAWDVQPFPTTLGPVTIPFTITDSGGAHLKQVVLYRAPYNATSCTAISASGCSWDKFQYANAPAGLDSWTSFFTDDLASFPIGSTFVYGLSITDNTGQGSFQANKFHQITVGTVPSSSSIPPVISNIQTQTTDISAVITWDTAGISDSQVQFTTGPCPLTTADCSTSLNTILTSSHTVTVSGLLSSTTYRYVVKSKNAGGSYTSEPNTFTTQTSSAFIDELLHEPDTSVMLQKAKDAGLTVESYIYDDGEVNIIKDPGTGEVVLSQRIEELSGGPGGLLPKLWAQAFMAYGYPSVTCDTAPDARVHIRSDGSVNGLNKSTTVTVKKPANMSDGTFNEIKSDLRDAINRINQDLDNFQAAGKGDTSKVPRFIDGLDGPSSPDGVNINLTETGGHGRTDYRQIRNGVDKTTIDLNTANTKGPGITNTLVHEGGHALGLDHINTLGNAMRDGIYWQPSDFNGEHQVHINDNQIRALISGHDFTKKLDTTNCKIDDGNGELSDRQVDWNSYLKGQYYLWPYIYSWFCGQRQGPMVAGNYNTDIFWASKGSYGDPAACGGVTWFEIKDGMMYVNGQPWLPDRSPTPANGYTLADYPFYYAFAGWGVITKDTYDKLRGLGYNSPAIPISPDTVLDPDTYPTGMRPMSAPSWPSGFDSHDVPPPPIPDYVKAATNDTIGNLPYSLGGVFHNPPTTYNVSISSTNISANGTSVYTIPVKIDDPSGADHISRAQFIINRQGSNAGSFNGYVAWSRDGSPYVGGKDEHTCTGGGTAAINPYEGYDPSNVTLDSCSVTTTSGRYKVVTFTVRFNPSFTGPTTNTISGSAENDMGSLGWQTGFGGSTFTLQDILPPTVSIVSPVASTTSYTTDQIVTLTASSTDNIAVSKVEFYDATVLKCTATTSPYTCAWPITSVNSGTHVWTAKAYDATGNASSSDAVTLVVNILVPTFSIISPTTGTTYTSAQTVTFSANTSDNIGVSKVEFYDDAVRKCTVVVSPYTCAWPITSVNNGTHNWTTKAYNAAGNTATSEAINLIVNITTSTVISSPLDSTGLIAAYSFDEASGLEVFDSSAKSNQASILGGATRVSVGKFGKAISFDGVNGLIKGPNITLGNTFTMMAWIYKDSTKTNGTMMTVGSGREVTTTNSAARMYYNSPSGNIISGPGIGSIAPGSWYHVALTSDGVNFKGYINGLNTSTTSLSFINYPNLFVTPSTGPIQIGQTLSPAYTSGSAYSYKGLLDEVRIFDRALSSSEILTAMNTPVGADTTVPTISITSPTNNSTVSSTVSITADVADNVGVAGVQFQLDGVNLGSELTSTPYTYSWDATTVTNTAHVLTAIAKDAAGNTATSPAVSVTVFNNNLPVGSFDGLKPDGFTLFGWSYDPDASSDSSTVQIFADGPAGTGTLISTITTNILRSDVNSASGVTGNHGFEIAIPANLQDGVSHSYYIYGIDSNDSTQSTLLSGSPKSFSVTAPDTTPPTVSITSPANNATIAGTVTVSADASDNKGVVDLQFQLDGSNVGSLLTSAPYTFVWDTTTVTNAPHVLTAIARDAAGNTTISTAVSVTVFNNTLPTGSFDGLKPDGFTLFGWSYDPDASSDSSTVQIFADGPAGTGTLISTITTNILRSDVNSASGVTGNHGFEIAIPANLQDGVSHSYYIYGIDSNDSTKSTLLAGSPQSFSYTAPDTTAPTVTITSPADSSTVNGTINITADAADNVGVSGVQFQIDGVNLGSEITAAPFTTSLDTTTITKGPHILTATASDEAGNTTTSTAINLTVFNNTLPVGSFDGLKPDGFTLFGWSYDPDTSSDSNQVQIFVDGPAGTGTLIATITTTVLRVDVNAASGITGNHGFEFAIPASLQTGTDHSYYAYAIDNNDSTKSTLLVGTYSIVPPPTVSIDKIGNTPNPDGATIDYTTSAMNISVNAKDSKRIASVRVTIEWDGGSKTINRGLRSGGYYVFSPFTPLSLGGPTQYKITAVATNRAGGKASSSATVKIADITPPSINITNPSNPTVRKSVNVRARVLDQVGVVGVQFKLDDNNLGSEVITSPKPGKWDSSNFIAWDTTQTSNGSHTLTAVARDSAGNTATSAPVTVTVNNVITDTTPPTVSIISPINTTYTTAQTVRVTAIATDNVGISKVEFYDGATLASTVNAVYATYFYDWPISSADNGTHSLIVKAYDVAGNFATSLPLILIVKVSVVVTPVTPPAPTPTPTPTPAPTPPPPPPADTTPPTTSIISPASNTTYTTAQTIRVTATATDNVGISKVEFYGDNMLVSTINTVYSTYYYDWPVSSVNNGNHNWTVRAYDAAGNIGYSQTTILSVAIIGADIPTVSISTPISGTVSGSAVSVTAIASSNVGIAGVQFKLDGSNLGAEITTAPYSISWNTTQTTDAIHTLSAVARNTAGNTSTATVTVIVSNNAPIVTITSPANGAIVSGIVTVSATASGSVGIASVQFTLDSGNLGILLTTAPYSISWNPTVSNGTHSIGVIATDNSGKTAGSSIVVYVVN